MGAPRFFVDDRLCLPSVGAELALPDDVAHHALRVLRLAVGDPITLFTGAGGEYAATLTRAGKRDAFVRIDAFDPRERESSLAVTLAQAIVASDAMDAIVRRSVELGVAALQPVVTVRSARFPAGAQGDKRLAHWRQIAVAACEQCGRNRVPAVHEPFTLDQWLAARTSGRAGVLLDPDAAAAFASLRAPAEALDLLVGPEGGLAPEEVARALRAGLEGARLGPRILRADTASLAALSAINLVWGDFK
jgi:16S rRNA (uracil1498-N3)-methyltransferase